ncbi:MAG: bacillithiol biosynthesis cysteine-adding enzyme BshC, partial [Clostridia bacterium]|nr:bacillithiol biosynthesis cysteine-adding enzyme BshC [Clostridia bacterium]
ADGALAVVTGQQAGAATGPLYTLYKAVTAVALARVLAAALERPVVPVFWVASEDHDLHEIATIHVLSRRGQVRRLSLPVPGGRRPSGSVPVPAGARRFVGELLEVCEGPWREEAAIALAETARAASSLADWFARLMAWLFRGTGLVFLDPMDPALRALLAPFFLDALVAREAVGRELRSATARLQARGYEPALTCDDDQVHLFLLDEGGERVALFWDGDGYADRDGRLFLGVAELARLAGNAPHRLSTDVVLRPVAQDVLLPTLAYVAGPGEVAYLAQLGGVYRVFGQEMPIIYPRLSLTVVPPEAATAMEAYAVRPGAGPEELDARLAEVMRQVDRVGLDHLFATHRARVEEAYAHLLARLAEVSPHLPDIGRGNLERVRRQIDYLEKKAWQHHRRRHREVARAFALVSHTLRPLGQMQERVLNGLPWVARGGRGFIEDLLTAPLTPGHHLARWEPAPAGEDPG